MTFSRRCKPTRYSWLSEQEFKEPSSLPQAVREHLEVCPACREHREATALVHRELSSMPRLRASEGFSVRVLTAITKAGPDAPIPFSAQSYGGAVLIPRHNFSSRWNLVFAAVASFFLIFLYSYVAVGPQSHGIDGLLRLLR